MQERLISLLEASSYPVRDVDQHAFGQADTEIEVKLYATAVEASELDRVIGQLDLQTGVRQAFWNASAEE